MALAVTHVLVTIIVLDLLRHYAFGVKKFPRYLVVIGGVAGLFPDIDLPIGWIVSWLSGSTVFFHGEYTHTFLWPLLFLAIGGVLHRSGRLDWAKVCYVIAAGWSMHIPLDCLHGGYDTFLWPLTFKTSAWCPQWGLGEFRAGIDAIILISWIVHEEIHHKIKDYI